MSLRRRKYILAGLVALAAVAVYLPALRNGFVNWDDYLYIVDNYHIRSLDGKFFRWALTDMRVSYWHPLAWASHAVDYALWGLNPMGHHLSSVLLHGINTFLVVVLAARLLEIGAALRPPAGPAGGSSFPDERTTLIAAGVTGLLFGIHPLHVESVAWVSERKDLLCALFFLLSVGAYLSYASDKSHRSYKTYFLSLLLFLLALMSKPMAVTLPAVLLLLDWYPLGRISSKKDAAGAVLEKVPFAALSVVVSLAAFAAQRAYGAVIPLEVVPMGDRLMTASRALVIYLWKTLLPLQLLPFYAFPRDMSFVSARYLFPAALVVGITAACLVSVGKEKMPAAVWGYYLVTLLPVIGIVKVGTVSVADRFTYLPGIGPFLLMGLAAAWIWSRTDSWRRWGPPAERMMVAAGILISVSLSYLTVKQTGHWENGVELWSYVIENNPFRCALAYSNRGGALQEKGQLDRALEDYNSAIAMDPAYADAYISRGGAFRKKKQFYRALDDFDKAVALSDDNADAYLGRGMLFADMGQFARAIADYDAVVRLQPFYGDAFLRRGAAFERLGRYESAIRDFTRVIDLDPNYGDAYVYRGIAYKETGRLDLAVADYDAALRLNPSNAEAYNSRGVAFLHLNRLDLAVTDYGRAIALKPDFFTAYCNRGIALGRLGRTDEAIKDYTRALELNPLLLKAYEERGRLYLQTGRREAAAADFQSACGMGGEEGCAALRGEKGL